MNFLKEPTAQSTNNGTMDFQAFRLKFDAAPQLTGGQSNHLKAYTDYQKMILIQDVQTLSDFFQHIMTITHLKPV